MMSAGTSAPWWRRRGGTALAVIVMWAMVAVVGGAAASSASPGKASRATAGVSLIHAAPVPASGRTPGGQIFTGMFSLRDFKTINGVVYAVGRLTGTIG